MNMMNEEEFIVPYTVVGTDYEPRKMTSGSVGYDLACRVAFSPSMINEGVWPKEWYKEEHGVVLLPLGISFAIPEGLEGSLRPRSSHITWLYPGTIDRDYRGELVIQAHVSRLRSVKAGERIAQIVFNHVPPTRPVRRAVLDSTARGNGGLGSTGR